MTEQHYFVCDAATWITDEKLDEAVKLLKAERKRSGIKTASYNVFLVPLPEASNYDIDMYQPQVDGTEYIGNFEY